MQELVEIGDPVFVHAHPGGRHAGQAEADRENDPGKADAADRGGEQVRIAVGADAADLAVRQKQVEPPDMIAEAADPIVILAVDVARHGSADRRLRRSGARRGDEPERQEGVEQIGEANPGLADQFPGGRVE